MNLMEHKAMERTDRRRWRQWKSWLPPVAAWPVVATAMAGLFFLTGREYRLGYLDHFHLEPSLFPDDLSNRVTYSTAAWVRALALAASSTSAVWRDHLILGILTPTLALLGVAIVLALMRTARQWASRQSVDAELPRWLHKAARAIGGLLLSVLRWLFPSEAAWNQLERARRIILGLWIGYLVVLIAGLVLQLSLVPFQYVGAQAGGADEAKQFADRAVVRLQDDPHQTYRLMECGPSYCALWSDHHAVVVPLSDLKRAESPVP